MLFLEALMLVIFCCGGGGGRVAGADIAVVGVNVAFHYNCRCKRRFYNFNQIIIFMQLWEAIILFNTPTCKLIILDCFYP